jgi:H+/Cl- antiporter ClcA
MSSAWLGVIASLGGVIVGAVATYLSQAFLWKRTTRRELYGSFAGRSNVCRDELLDVAYAIRRNLPENERTERFEKANAQMAEVSSLAAQVSMVATMATRSATEALEGYLSSLKAELHQHNRDGTTPKKSEEYLVAYSAALKSFTATASKELGIARTRRRIPGIAK